MDIRLAPFPEAMTLVVTSVEGGGSMRIDASPNTCSANATRNLWRKGSMRFEDLGAHKL